MTDRDYSIIFMFIGIQLVRMWNSHVLRIRVISNDSITNTTYFIESYSSRSNIMDNTHIELLYYYQDYKDWLMQYIQELW